MLRYISIKRYLPEWLRSEAGEFFLDALSLLAAASELTYWVAHH